MAFSDPNSDLDQLISSAMGSAFDGARRTLVDEIRRRGEGERREARERGFRLLREATARLDAAREQSELLAALVEEAGRFASRTALLLTRPDAAQGWAALGFEAGIEGVRLGYDTPGLGRIAAGRGAAALGAEECAPIAQQLGGAAPVEGVLVPLVLRDRVAAALYADRLKAEDTFAPAALQLLVFTAAQLLELQSLRQRTATPTLHGADAAEAAEGLPLWDAAAVAAASVAAAPAEAAEPAAVEQAETPAETPAPWDAPVEAGEPWAAEAEPVSAGADWSLEEPAAAPAAEEPAAMGEELWSYEPALEEVSPESDEEITAVTTGRALLEPAAETPEVAAVAEPEPETAEELGAEAVEEVAAEEPAAAPEPWEHTAAEEPAWEERPAPDSAPAWQQQPEPAPAPPPASEPTPWYRPAPVSVEPPPAPPTVAPPAELPGESQATAPWRIEPVEPVTSQIRTETAGYPSEATVRISRDLLPSEAPAAQPDVSDDATVMLPRPAAAPPAPPVPEVEHTRPTPVAEPPRPHSTEVQPPPDLEGPGWAFRNEGMPSAHRAAPADEGAALHEEARRLARLLVSEIKLYNEEQVEEGRRNRDIYPRLQDDIDRSRQMYDERVDPRIKGEVDYFQQEVVNILAGGDAGALGM